MRRPWMLLLVLIGGSLVASPKSAYADILYQNNYPGSVGGGWCSPCNGVAADWRVWDLFTLAEASTLQSAEFLIHDISPNGLQDLEVSIWDSTRTNVLYSAVFNNTQYTTSVAFAPDNLLVNVDLPNWNLDENTPYYVSLFGLNGSAFGWRSDFTDDGSVVQRLLSSNTDFNRGDDAAFTLFGVAQAVPEPASMIVFGLMAAGGVGYIRNRRLAKA